MSVSRIYRVLRLITLLQSGRSFTADELSQELEVSRRTVFRDLNMLEMAHIPYYFDEDRKCYRISQHFFLPPVNLSLGEALAVLMLSGGLKSSSSLPLLSEGAKAAIKIESALPSAIRQHVGSVMDNIHFSLGPTSKHEALDGIFNDLAAAIAKKSICKIIYISFHEKKQLALQIHPLRLLFQNRGWYVIAYSPEHGQCRTFKLGRIRKLTPTVKTFSHVALANDNYFGKAWSMIPEGKLYDIHLRFSPKVAGNVTEVHWHDSQKVTWNKDGTADLFFTVDGLGEISWWILGYGDNVQVLSPTSLRKHMAEVCSRMLRNYQEAN